MRGLPAIGVLCLVLSGWLIWVKAPISGGVHPGLSFGWLAGVLGGIAGIAWFRSSSSVMAVCGIAGLGLVSFAILYLAFIDPALWDLVDENAQAASIINFSHRFLPGNFGIQPTFHPDLDTGTAQDRLATALYFMSWGWVISLVGSLFLLLAWSLKPDRRESIKWMSLTAVLMFGGQAVMVGHSLAAEYIEALGNRSLALGRYAEAGRRYERAQRWNPQLARSLQAHLRLGEAYYHLDMLTHPNVRLYLGQRYAQEGNYKAALGEYLLGAQEANEPLKTVHRKRIAWSYADGGILLYRKGLYGPASGYWEQSLAFDAAQLQAPYFLARAYFEQTRYEQSIAMSRFLLTRSRNPLLNANLQFNIGDCYWRLGDFNQARRAYEASMRLDAYGNFRIYKSLGGT
jgi:tetratricopeptide (TPR) repeat protein